MSSLPPPSSPLDSLRTQVSGIGEMMIRNLTDLNSYVDVLNTPLRRSIITLSILYLIIGVMSSLIFSIRTLPALRAQVTDTIISSADQFPADARYEWDGQRLTGSPEELAIKLPADSMPSLLPDHLLIVDMTSDATASASTSALAVVTDDTLFINTRSGSWMDSPLRELSTTGSVSITPEMVHTWRDRAISLSDSVLTLLPLLVALVMSLGLFISRLILIAIDSIIVQFIFMAMGKQLPYRKVFQLSLHVLIPVELLTQVTALLYPHLDFPMTSVSYWLVIGLLLYHLRNLATPPSRTPSA